MSRYPLIIAVDYDGTLCEEQWPGIGAPNMPLINYLLEKQAAGAELILYTCREGQELEDAIAWAESFGLKFAAVNDNVPRIKEIWGDIDYRKPFANLYIDDHNISEKALRKHGITLPYKEDTNG